MNLRCLLVLALAGTCGAIPLGRAAEPLRLEEAGARALANIPSLPAEAAHLRAIQACAQCECLPTLLFTVVESAAQHEPRRIWRLGVLTHPVA